MDTQAEFTSTFTWNEGYFEWKGSDGMRIGFRDYVSICPDFRNTQIFDLWKKLRYESDLTYLEFQPDDGTANRGSVSWNGDNITLRYTGPECGHSFTVNLGKKAKAEWIYALKTWRESAPETRLGEV